MNKKSVYICQVSEELPNLKIFKKKKNVPDIQAYGHWFLAIYCNVICA